jgi:hypothetical protein
MSFRIYSLEGIFGNEEMRVAWNGFGKLLFIQVFTFPRI